MWTRVNIAVMHFVSLFEITKVQGVILNKSDMPILTLLTHMGQVSDIAYVVDQYVSYSATIPKF